MDFAGKDRQLTRVREAEHPIDADQVAQVKRLLRQFKVIFADLLLADKQLNLAGPIFDIDEDQFARWPAEHDAARGANGGTRYLADALI